MRVAIVCRDLGGLGGTTRVVVENARGFVARGWQVDVLAYAYDRQRVEETGARLRPVPGIPWGSWTKRRLFAAAADWMTRGYDAVHGHGDALRQDVMSLHNCVHAAHEAIHGTPLPAANAVGRLHALQLSERRFRVLICNSKMMADEVRRRFGVPPEMTRVIYPAYDPGQFNMVEKERLRAEGRAELGLGADDTVVGLITSGDFVKRGVKHFIEAIAQVSRRRPGLKAVVIGKEARLAPYEAQARRLGVADIMRFHPSGPRVERYYHALDVYCLPALYEEFGMSVEEALACGVPAVCGDKVGAAELFPPEMRRFAVDPRGPELADRLEELAADAGLRARLAAAAPSAVAGNTWAANVAATADCLVKR